MSGRVSVCDRYVWASSCLTLALSPVLALLLLPATNTYSMIYLLHFRYAPSMFHMLVYRLGFVRLSRKLLLSRALTEIVLIKITVFRPGIVTRISKYCPFTSRATAKISKTLGTLKSTFLSPKPDFRSNGGPTAASGHRKRDMDIPFRHRNHLPHTWHLCSALCTITRRETRTYSHALEQTWNQSRGI